MKGIRGIRKRRREIALPVGLLNPSNLVAGDAAFSEKLGRSLKRRRGIRKCRSGEWLPQFWAEKTAQPESKTGTFFTEAHVVHRGGQSVTVRLESPTPFQETGSFLTEAKVYYRSGQSRTGSSLPFSFQGCIPVKPRSKKTKCHLFSRLPRNANHSGSKTKLPISNPELALFNTMHEDLHCEQSIPASSLEVSRPFTSPDNFHSESTHVRFDGDLGECDSDLLGPNAETINLTRSVHHDNGSVGGGYSGDVCSGSLFNGGVTTVDVGSGGDVFGCHQTLLHHQNCETDPENRNNTQMGSLASFDLDLRVDPANVYPIHQGCFEDTTRGRGDFDGEDQYFPGIASKHTELVQTPGSSNDTHKPKHLKQMRWTPEMHQIFLEVVAQLGEKASPKRILEHLNLEGVTVKHVKSHLQKHRQKQKQKQTSVTVSHNKIQFQSEPVQHERTQSDHVITGNETSLSMNSSCEVSGSGVTRAVQYNSLCKSSSAHEVQVNEMSKIPSSEVQENKSRNIPTQEVQENELSKIPIQEVQGNESRKIPIQEVQENELSKSPTQTLQAAEEGERLLEALIRPQVQLRYEEDSERVEIFQTDGELAQGSVVSDPKTPDVVDVPGRISKKLKRGRVRKEKKYAIIVHGADEATEWANKVAKFQNLVRPVLGNLCKACKWGGSVLDSVVGVFLTQNTSDTLSSAAFMILMAEFPPSSDTPPTSPPSSSPQLSYSHWKATLPVKANQRSRPEKTTKVASAVVNSSDGQDTANQTQHGNNSNTEGEFVGSVELQTHERCLEMQMLDLVERRFAALSLGAGFKEDGYNDQMCKIQDAKTHTSNSSMCECIPSEHDAVEEPQHEESSCEAQKSHRSWSRIVEGQDSVDWSRVLHADIGKIAECIKVRGLQNTLAIRIKKCLEKIQSDFGCLSLEHLRLWEAEHAKEYLLTIMGLGWKSVACLQLLTLRHPEFPVDTNVGRITSRLGWVPLDSEEGVALEDLDQYANADALYGYLKKHLSAFDEATLYEMHYMMITLGKVFCSKKSPNCSSCPLNEVCEYASNGGKRYSPLVKSKGKSSQVQKLFAADKQKIGECSSSVVLTNQNNLRETRHEEKFPILNGVQSSNTVMPTTDLVDDTCNQHTFQVPEGEWRKTKDGLQLQSSWGSKQSQHTRRKLSYYPVLADSCNFSNVPFSKESSLSVTLEDSEFQSFQSRIPLACSKEPDFAGIGQRNTTGSMIYLHPRFAGLFNRNMMHLPSIENRLSLSCIRKQTIEGYVMLASVAKSFQKFQERSRVSIALPNNAKSRENLPTVDANTWTSTIESSVCNLVFLQGGLCSTPFLTIPQALEQISNSGSNCTQREKILKASEMCNRSGLTLDCPSPSGEGCCTVCLHGSDSPQNAATVNFNAMSTRSQSKIASTKIPAPTFEVVSETVSGKQSRDQSIWNLEPSMKCKVLSKTLNSVELTSEQPSENATILEDLYCSATPRTNQVQISGNLNGESWENHSPSVSNWVEPIVVRTSEGEISGPQESSPIARANAFESALIPDAPPSFNRNYKRVEAVEIDPGTFDLPSYLPPLLPEDEVPYLAFVFEDFVKTGDLESQCDVTFLVPSRSALRGAFPLNGTYFQVNEVFVDAISAANPVTILSSTLIGRRRRQLYCGSSIIAISKGMSNHEVTTLFMDGFITVRSWDPHSGHPSLALPEFLLPFATSFRRKRQDKSKSEANSNTNMNTKVHDTILPNIYVKNSSELQQQSNLIISRNITGDELQIGNSLEASAVESSAVPATQTSQGRSVISVSSSPLGSDLLSHQVSFSELNSLMNGELLSGPSVQIVNESVTNSSNAPLVASLSDATTVLSAFCIPNSITPSNDLSASNAIDPNVIIDTTATVPQSTMSDQALHLGRLPLRQKYNMKTPKEGKAPEIQRRTTTIAVDKMSRNSVPEFMNDGLDTISSDEGFKLPVEPQKKKPKLAKPKGKIGLNKSMDETSNTMGSLVLTHPNSEGNHVGCYGNANENRSKPPGKLQRTTEVPEIETQVPTNLEEAVDILRRTKPNAGNRVKRKILLLLPFLSGDVKQSVEHALDSTPFKDNSAGALKRAVIDVVSKQSFPKM